jgi:ferritin-like metal-binding protein YciE
MKKLEDLFLAELADMYDAERRLIKTLPQLARAATCEKLKAAFLAHVEETKGHAASLEKVFNSFGKKAQGKTCEATVGLLKEAGEIAADNKGEPTINAALICAGQKVEHYEIASYGCLHEWAELLENRQAARLIEQILSDKKDANIKLMELARGGANNEALCRGDEKESKDMSPANLRRGVRPIRSGRKPAGFLA